MSGRPLLEFRAASVGYGSTTVVSRADLEVAGGEFVGLVGPNGAGKSTMLRAVTGGARVLDGAVLAGGRDVGAMTDRERACLIAVLPQALPSAFSFSARQFVEMGRHPHLGRFDPLGPHDAEAVDRAMELTDTARLSAEPVDALSGGDLQRLVLAQALAQEPRVLLLDEPTSHLDLDHRLQVLDLVRDLADAGTAVVAVFHDLDLAARYSDRLAVVHAGALGPVGPPSEVLTADLVARVFAVRAVVGIDPVTGSVSVTPVLRDAAVAPSRDGRVLVVSGSGSGASLMRALVSAGWRVAAAALNTGDTDHGVASTLGLKRVDLPAFGEMDGAAEDAVAALAEAADVVVVADVPFGRTNVGNLRAAVRSGRPLVLVGEMAPERDFTGGEAARLWDDAVTAGAALVRDAASALAAVEGLLGGEDEA